MVDPIVALIGFLGSAAAVLASLRWFGNRRPRSAYRLSFPRTLTERNLLMAVRSVHGVLPGRLGRLTGTPAVVIEAVATPAGIEHRLLVPRRVAGYLVGQLRAALPGLRIEAIERPVPPAVLARELRAAGPGTLRLDAVPATNAGALAALQPLAGDEFAVLQWAVRPKARDPLPVVLRHVRDRLVGDRDRSDDRDTEPVFAAVCRVGAGGGRAERLVARVLGSLHQASTPHALLRRRWLPRVFVRRRIALGSAPSLGASLMDAAELSAVVGVPVDGPQLPGLTLVGARELPVHPAVPRRGRILGDGLGTAPRPIALDLEESKRGLLLTAPTGGGKSTVLEHLCAQDFAAGHPVVVVESKGDLICALADLVPPHRTRDVVIFDPADSRPVGFNLLAGGDEAADLITDHVVSQFKSLYTAYLGPRSEMLLRAALLTLSRSARQFTICEVIPLLADAAFRHRLVGELDDHVLAGVWSWFEGQTEAAQAEMVAPLTNKLAAFTLRRRLRAVVGQAESALDFERAFARRQIVLVSLAKGLVGEDAASLIGSALLGRLWAAVQARAALPPGERHFVSVVLDEAQDFLRLPIALSDAVAQSRGLGVGWTVAHQNLGQLDGELRQAVLANLRSKLVFQTTAADAAVFAREFAPHLAAGDLQGLGPFEAYAAVSTGAAVAPPASVRTRPAPARQGHGDLVRSRSRERFGRPAAEVEAELRSRVAHAAPEVPIGARRRS